MAERAGSDRPGNVLLIVADQWRWDCLSALGHPTVRTPHLDALAAEGTLFASHFTQASPCGPARASLLTGLYLMNHRSVANGTPLDQRFDNLAWAARRQGLTPFLFGYTDASPDPRFRAPADPDLTSYEGVLPGFEVGLRMTEAFKPWRAALKRRGYALPDAPYGPFPAGRDPEGRRHPLAASPFDAKDSLSAFGTDAFLDWLSVEDGRWLSLLTFLHPHPPLLAPAPYHALFAPADCPPPSRLADPAAEAALHPFLGWYHGERQVLAYSPDYAVPVAELNAAEVRRVRATYYGLIAEVDAQVGRIVEALKASGRWDDTLIVFTVDHGEMLGDHWMFGKRGFFDPAFRIPLIVRDPRPEADRARGRVVEAFSEAVDVMPTVIDWLGGAVPPACDGASLRPWLHGETPSGWRDAAHFEFDFRDPVTRSAERALGLPPEACCLAVRRGPRWKSVHFAGPAGILPPLLFDLESDPGEFENLAAAPAHQARLLEETQALLSWRLAQAPRELADLLVTARGVVGP
ncbi:Arylsulfatase A [Tistlia consotensis]|uniref:Arylsulfatase A n=1 Tax=Tistlia consotensis USBA 355 TaxID=560819 RepID=A0A1Y6B7D8_9PROT|nr:alkaline phosphatase family protein [Tistlia consotensis]SME96936.1 Arylsulfatase A [Tistlia consotensis USBA 355]SNR56340.1 Arylsulfatase A [Tistlia consotensis]